MLRSSVIRAGLLGASLCLTSLCLTSLGAQAAPSPFTALAGRWSGGGTLNTSDGQQEQMRCRAHYSVAPDGTELRLNLRCASASYHFNLDGDVRERGGEIRGSWSESTRNASGSISGRAVGDRIEAAAAGQNFSAKLSLTTRRNRQAVFIRPQGTNITSVALTLYRR
jgi:hypothetical protein